MNIKIGDKVRIKTEEEMLADGYIKEGTSLYNPQARRYFVDPMKNYCGQIVTIDKMVSDLITIKEDNGMCFYDETMIAKAISQTLLIAEVLPQTLDEYICSLSLEERAERFLYRNAILSISLENDEGYDREEVWWLSAITSKGYLTYEEALQATIEALKQTKE